MPESFAGITVPEGEPGGLRAAARQFNAFALAVDGCSDRVRSLPGQLADWRGPASARFAGAAQEHADAAGGAVSALSAAGQAAAHYAEALHDAQEDARRAIDDARDATDRIKTLERQIQEARDREAAANERAASAGIALDTAAATGLDDPIAANEFAAATQAATDARGDQIVLTRRLEDAKDDLERAQKRGERAEKAARIAGRAAAAGFSALGDCVLYVSGPGAAATAAVGSGHVPPMYPPHRPGRGPMSDAASGDGYRTHGDPLRFYRQWAAEQEAKRQAAEAAKQKDDGGGLFGKIVHGGLDLAGLVPVIGEPADLANAGIYALEGDMTNAALSGGAALPFVGMAATGAKWGKRAVDVADELHDASKALPSGGSYPSHGTPFNDLSAADQQAARAWQDGLPKMETPTSRPSGQYEVDQTGPFNYKMGEGDDAINADGFRSQDGSALEAKHVGSHDRSPYVPDSNAPDFMKAKARADFEDELDRYGKVIGDGGNPVRGLEVITNDPRAARYFEDILDKYDIPSQVVVRGDAP
jgi:hypothetical protein